MAAFSNTVTYDNGRLKPDPAQAHWIFDFEIEKLFLRMFYEKIHFEFTLF